MQRFSLIREAMITELDRHRESIDTTPDLRQFCMLVYLHGDCIEHIEVRKNSELRPSRLDKKRS